jgi:hypothetical protein
VGELKRPKSNAVFLFVFLLLDCSPDLNSPVLAQRGRWREDPAEEEKRPADWCRLINLRFASPLATG